MSIESPFGKSITSEDIVDTLSFFDDWEERYKYIIDLGKELPGMSDDKKTDDFLLRGCQSQVWLIHMQDPADGKIKTTTRQAIERAPSHPDGKFIFYANKA